MLRFTTATALALAISLPLSTLAAETAIDSKAPPQAAVVAAAASGDALPVANNERKAEPSEQSAPKRLVPHGSSQSSGGYRFTTPYAAPPQTLPVGIPSLSAFHF